MRSFREVAEQTVKRAVAEAHKRAEQKYRDDIAEWKRAAEEAKSILKAKSEEMDKDSTAIEERITKSAKELADALYQKTLTTKKDELSKLEDRAKKAQDASSAAYEAKKLLDEAIQRNKEALSRMNSADTEGAEQAKMAEEVAEFLGASMSELMLFEHGPHQLSIRKFDISAQICDQFAQAIRNFISPRLT